MELALWSKQNDPNAKICGPEYWRKYVDLFKKCPSGWTTGVFHFHVVQKPNFLWQMYVSCVVFSLDLSRESCTISMWNHPKRCVLFSLYIDTKSKTIESNQIYLVGVFQSYGDQSMDKILIPCAQIQILFVSPLKKLNGQTDICNFASLYLYNQSWISNLKKN